MRTREIYLQKQATLKDSETVIEDINLVDPLSFLEIRYEATNGVTSCLDRQLKDDVTQISIVDGSDVMGSLSMPDWQALGFYTLGRLPRQRLSELGGAVQEESVIIPFGRFPYDPDHYLVPGRFKNPQLKLSHALMIDAINGFAAGSGKLTIIAHVMEQGAAPAKGFMMSKVHDSFTTVAAGDHITHMPLDHPWRMLLVRSERTLTSFADSIANMKLSVDIDRFIPFDIASADLADRAIEWFGKTTQHKTLLTAHGGVASMGLHMIEQAGIRTDGANLVATVTGITAEQLTTGLYDLGAVPIGAPVLVPTACHVSVLGSQPYSTLAWPFGLMNEPGSWLDAQRNKNIRLILTQAAAGANTAIILQQLRN